MRRLSKRHVEQLMTRYDSDPVGAVESALQHLYDLPATPFAELVAHAPLTDERRRSLLRHDLDALDALATELNENRALGS